MNASYKTKADCLYVKVSGEYLFNTARGILFELSEKLRGCNLKQILCDITLVKGISTFHPSTMEQFDLCLSAVQSIPKHIKLAILIHRQYPIKDRFSENVMVNRGLIVKFSSKKNELLEWLGKSSSGICHESTENLFVYLYNNSL